MPLESGGQGMLELEESCCFSEVSACSKAERKREGT